MAQLLLWACPRSSGCGADIGPLLRVHSLRRPTLTQRVSAKLGYGPLTPPATAPPTVRLEQSLDDGGTWETVLETPPLEPDYVTSGVAEIPTTGLVRAAWACEDSPDTRYWQITVWLGS